MANRLMFTDDGEIGLICNLTNTYCLVGTGGSENFYSSIEAEFEDVIPIIKTSIGGSSSVGRYCIGNKNGLLLPHTTTYDELQHIKRSVPDEVVVQLIEEGLTSYGQFIACNDHVAFAHADLHWIHPNVSKKVLDELSAALEVPLESGTVNRGSVALAPGMAVNDWTAFCGSSSTRAELRVIDRVFKLRGPYEGSYPDKKDCRLAITNECLM